MSVETIPNTVGSFADIAHSTLFTMNEVNHVLTGTVQMLVEWDILFAKMNNRCFRNVPHFAQTTILDPTAVNFTGGGAILNFSQGFTLDFPE